MKAKMLWDNSNSYSKSNSGAYFDSPFSEHIWEKLKENN